MLLTLQGVRIAKEYYELLYAKKLDNLVKNELFQKTLQTIKNERQRNKPQLMLWGQHYPDTKIKDITRKVN